MLTLALATCDCTRRGGSRCRCRDSGFKGLRTRLLTPFINTGGRQIVPKKTSRVGPQVPAYSSGF